MKNTSRLRPLLLCALVLCALTALVHREVLLGQQVYHHEDAADGYYPARAAFHRALSEGTLPSWEPNAEAGWPLLADPYYGYFYPLNAVFYLGPRKGEPSGGPEGVAARGVPSGLGYAAALHTLIAGVGMLLLLRRRLSTPAALYGAVAYALSSFLIVRIRHIIFVQLAAWLPWLLWAIDDAVGRLRRREPVAGALVRCGVFTALVLIVGAHSLLHFAALLLSGYALARIAGAALDPPPGESGAAETPAQKLRFAVRAALSLGGAAALGVLCAMVALLPTLHAMPHTARALGTDYTFASSYAWPGLRYAQLLLMPDLLGMGEFRTAPVPWLGRWNHWEMAGYYQGALAVLLAVPGALLGRGEQARARGDRLLRGVLLLLALLGVLTALGDAGPTHPLLFRIFPLYSALRCPARALFLCVVTLPILAAYGADAIFGARKAPSDAPRPAETDPETPKSSARKRLLWGLLSALLCVALGLGLSHLATRLTGHGEQRVVVVGQAVAHLLAVLGGLAAALSLRYVGRVRGALPLAILVAVTAADQVSVDRGYVSAHPLDFPDGTERFAAVEWVLAQTRGEPPGQSRFVNDPAGPFRLMALGQTVGRESASGYSSLGLWRYLHYLYVLRHGRTYPHPKLRDDLAAAGVWNLGSPLVDALNVRYLVGTDPPSPKWVLRFQPAPGAPLSAAFEPYWDPRLKAFENTAVMPRAYVAYQARFAPTERAEAEILARPDFDPHREIIVGLGTGSPQPVLENGGRAHTPATVVEHGRHLVVIEAMAHAPGVLVLADAYFPGWTATVDGAPRPILPVDLALRGVALSPGRHRIEMTFTDTALRRGAALSLAGLVGLFALGAGALLSRRARRGAR